MADILTNLALVLDTTLATLGTTDITLGLMAAAGLVIGAAVSFARRAGARK